MSIKIFSKLFLLIVIAVFLAHCGGGNDSTTPVSTTGSIMGTASTGSTDSSLAPSLTPGSPGSVLAGAIVYVIDYDGNSYGPATTDANGNFTITGLPISKSNFVVKIIKDKIVLRDIVSSVVAGQTLNIGQVDMTTTALIHMIEKRIKKETGQNITLGDTDSIPTSVKTKIQNVDITQEKTDFKNSIQGDSTSANPIYVVYATIVAVLENANNSNISLNDFLNNPTHQVTVTYGDGSTEIKTASAIDTDINDVKTISSFTITPDSVTIYQDSSIQFSVTAVFSNGDTLNITDSAAYLNKFGTISKGLFNADNETGYLNLKIQYWGYSSSVPITVLYQPIATFSKLFGNADDEYVWAISQLSDGNYIAGGAKEQGNHPAYLIKIDSNGNEIFSKNIISGDEIHSIKTSPDTGFLILSDKYIIKYNNDCETIWQKNINYWPFRGDIILTNDGGFLTVGNTAEPLGNSKGGFIEKYNSSGDTEWNKIIKNIFTYTAVQNNDNSYILTGEVYKDTVTYDMDLFLMKVDNTGDSIWLNYFGGSNQERLDNAIWGENAIQFTNDSALILVGTSSSTDIVSTNNNGSKDILVVKVNSSGETIWQNLYGGSGDDYGAAIQSSPDGGYLIAGISNSTNIQNVTNNGEYDLYLIKIDSNGNKKWEKLYGGNGIEGVELAPSFAYFFLSLEKTRDGGYIIAMSSNSSNISGTTNSGGYDVYILKIDSNGNLNE